MFLEILFRSGNTARSYCDAASGRKNNGWQSVRMSKTTYTKTYCRLMPYYFYFPTLQRFCTYTQFLRFLDDIHELEHLHIHALKRSFFLSV